MRATTLSDQLPSAPELRFDGAVIWITGASRGLGRGLALALAGAGAEVVLTGRSGEALRELVAAITRQGGRATAMVGSVNDPADIAAATASIERTHGRLDALINNAGISPYFTRAERLKEVELSEVLNTNLVGAFACCKAALPLLEKARAGNILNISSVHGSRSHHRLLAYSASKGGLEMVTRSLADEWADRGVRVNSLAPGYIETEMTEGLRRHDGWREELLGRIPLARFARVEEVVACAMFLVSELSTYVTGATLAVDGGWSVR